MFENVKAFRTSVQNEKVREKVNAYQRDKDKPTVIGKHREARPWIPMEINGDMVLMCPDTGDKTEIPLSMLNYKN